MSDPFSVEITDHIAVVTWEGPRKGNPMGPACFDQLPVLFRELDRNNDVRVVVLRSGGPQFSYGLDLAAMAGSLGPMLNKPGARERMDFVDLLQHLQAGMHAVASCRKPVIVAVNGWCIGGGLDLICACDIRLASADTKISLRETRMAMVADLGTLQRLPLIVGQGPARRMAFTGGDIDAAEAHRIGLVDELFDTPAALLEGAMTLAAEIAANPPLAVEGAKRVLNFGMQQQVRQGLDYVAAWNAAFVPSEDLTEAVQAFMMKRDATFKGR